MKKKALKNSLAWAENRATENYYRNRRLEEALGQAIVMARKYGRHFPICAKVRRRDATCTCGYENMLSHLEEVV